MNNPETEPIYKGEFQSLLEAVYGLLPDQAEPLAYEDPIEESDEVRLKSVGVERVINHGLMRDGESVRVCICDEDGRYNLGEVLRHEHGIEVLPVGFIEFQIEREGASFSSCAYMLESGAVAALIDTSIDEDAVLSEESEDCLDFADQLGLSRYWAKAMFLADGPGANKLSRVVDLSAHQIDSARNFLNSLEDRV